MILTTFQKLPNNVGDLSKIIVATSFEWLSKVQKIAQSGHTGLFSLLQCVELFPYFLYFFQRSGCNKQILAELFYPELKHSDRMR